MKNSTWIEIKTAVKRKFIVNAIPVLQMVETLKLERFLANTLMIKLLELPGSVRQGLHFTVYVQVNGDRDILSTIFDDHKH